MYNLRSASKRHISDSKKPVEKKTRKMTADDWRKELPIYRVTTTNEWVYAIDMLPYYKTLKRHSCGMSYAGACDGDKCDCEGANVVYEETSYNIKNNHTITLTRFADAVCDIKVHNATYAYLSGARDGSNKIPLVKVGDVFTSPDITVDNPLFYCGSLDSYATIITDGVVTTKHLFIMGDVRKIVLELYRYYSHMVRLGSVNKVMLNSFYLPSCIVSEDELVDVSKYYPQHSVCTR